MSRVRAILTAFVTTLLLVVPMSAQAQTGNVAGRVFDASNMRPLEGVQIEVSGRGAISGADGRFLITNVPVGPQTVRATIIGYASSETARRARPPSWTSSSPWRPSHWRGSW